MHVHESLSSAKISFNRSAFARRISFSFSSFANTDALASVSSRVMTTTGTVVADLAVLGLKTRVLRSSNSFGAPDAFDNAVRHSVGDVCGPCDTELDGAMERFERRSVAVFTPAIAAVESERMGRYGDEGVW